MCPYDSPDTHIRIAHQIPWPDAHEIFLLVEVRSSVEGLEVAA